MPRSRSWKKPSRTESSCASVQVSKDGSWDRADSGTHDHAGDRIDQEISYRRRLLLVLPLCGSQKLSNGKKKGQGNTKNGNKHLAWPYVEAANFAIRYNARVKSFYQRKKAKRHGVLAIKAVAHKLCRACYHILKDQVPFDITKAFA